MPLSPEERQRLLQKAQQGVSPEPVESGLPPEVQALMSQAPSVPSYIPSISRGGVRIALPQPPEADNRELAMEQARLLLKQRYQAPTETERERGSMVRSAESYIDDVEKTLAIDRELGKVGNRAPLSASRDFLPDVATEYVQSPEAKQLYNSLDSALTQTAIIVTGRQGDVQKFEQLKKLYRLSPATDDATIIKRLGNLRKLVNTFESGNLSGKQMNQQMDQLIGDETDRVQVKGSDGSSYTIPRRQLEQARKQGFQPVTNAANR